MSSDLESSALDTPTDEPQAEKLQLEVDIQKPSACQRRIAVTIPRDDVERYFSKALGEFAPKAQVPGFRAGRAPRKLVESRFREQLKDQVKGGLVMDSMSQINDDYELAAISEPSFDYDAIELPDDGPMRFEFELEVRPEFDLPQWQGLSIEKPVRDFTDADIDKQLLTILAQQGEMQRSDEPVASDDYVTLNFTFRHGGEVIAALTDETVQVRPTLTFSDTRLDKFDQLLAGARPGDRRTTTATIAHDAANEALRGQDVEVEVEVLDVERLVLPELDSAILERLGGFADEASLREAVRANLERQLTYHQHRRVREQITGLLVQAADWDLPPDLLRRQARRELDRAVLELQSSGFSDQEIRAHQNELRQNSLRSTARALKEHFILERIAEEEKIDAEPHDYDTEVTLIAMQSNESPRRVRARLEKRGLMDSLRNQIVERKVIARIKEHAQVNEVVFELPSNPVEAVDFEVSSTGVGAEIPEAKPGGSVEPLPGSVNTVKERD